MTTLLFVRHGVTDHTGQRLSGWMPGVHLNATGIAQAEAAADALAGAPLDAIYTSPIERCTETAAVIARRHEMKATRRDALKDTKYGKWTDRPLRSVAKTRSWQVLHRFPSAFRFPGGETLRETQARVVQEIERIWRDHPRQLVCCVAHADPIALTLAHYMGLHIDLFPRLAIAPASISALRLEDDGPQVLAVAAPPNGFAFERRAVRRSSR